MPFAIKLILSNIVIVTCVFIGKKLPSLAGLISAMPLTTLIVLIWLYNANKGDDVVTTAFVEGVFWGIFPTMIFFAVAMICLRRGLPFLPTIAISVCAWLLGAIIHQVFLK